MNPLLSDAPPSPRFADISLALQLRQATAALHLEVEEQLGLPDSITGLPGYTSFLERFHGIYRPLEKALRCFSGWSSIDIDLAERAQTARLAADLHALGVDVAMVPDAPTHRLPALPDFAHALGALYVIEGSTLGSQYILPRLIQTLGAGISGADAFFRGHGAQTPIFWKQFRGSLDRYGLENPEQTPDVVDGAQATFKAMGSWLQP